MFLVANDNDLWFNHLQLDSVVTVTSDEVKKACMEVSMLEVGLLKVHKTYVGE